MKTLRLTWKPPGTPLAHEGADTIRRALFALHLIGSLMVLLAVWPPGWRLGEPALSSPFRNWWGVEVLFLGLLSLQLGAGRWRAPLQRAAGEDTPPHDDLLWLVLTVVSAVPTGVAAYRAGPLPPAHPANLVASLAAELFFFMSVGRTLRASGLREPALGLATWGLFLVFAAGVWMPGLRTWQPWPGGSPLPTLGPIPFPSLLDQPAVIVGPWYLPFPLATGALWALAALAVRNLGRRRDPRERRGAS